MSAVQTISKLPTSTEAYELKVAHKFYGFDRFS